MAFLSPLLRTGERGDPLRRQDHAEKMFGYTDASPPKPPPPPNPNDAANAAQQQTDALRMRRGILSNLISGSQAGLPAVGKTQLGT